LALNQELITLWVIFILRLNNFAIQNHSFPKIATVAAFIYKLTIFDGIGAWLFKMLQVSVPIWSYSYPTSANRHWLSMASPITVGSPIR